MKLLSTISIENFLSIRNETVEDIDNFVAIIGTNNAGKSNILRALNVFFNNEIELGVPIDLDRDYCKGMVKSRKKKNIRISVRFKLPASFSFRKELEPAKVLLGSNEFSITKEWSKENILPEIYLNDSATQLNDQDKYKIGTFLSLINFRYIPNRVLPTEVIRNENKAFRDVLTRRLARTLKDQQQIFEGISKTSENLIKSLSKHVQQIYPQLTSMRLSTPSSWADLLFNFGYKLKESEYEIDDTSQGSGMQSLLMFETLYLIDQDYFQRFGWRQASIWAVEEPESSLHTSLEANIAQYLREISRKTTRLQIFATTHSDLFMQYSDKCYFVKKKEGLSNIQSKPIGEALELSSKQGISRWVHPILYNPMMPLLIPEGKYDYAFFNQAFRIMGVSEKIKVSYLEKIANGAGITGGDSSLLQYIKSSINVIKARNPKYPVIVVLDWDSASKLPSFRSLFSAGDPFKIFAWNSADANPRLSDDFHGIERHMPDRIITKAKEHGARISTFDDGSLSIVKGDYGKFKSIVADIVKRDLREEDLQFSKSFLISILKSVGI